nr:MFS transporter [Bradyrhizobium sp. 6(2017)]
MAWFQEGERGFAMSLRQMSVPAGGAVGALILPALARYLGFGAVYGVLAILCFAVAAFAWIWLHEPPMPPAVASRQSEPEPNPARGVLSNGQIWRTVCGLGALCVPQVVAVTFAAVFLNDIGHLGTAAISASIVTFQLGAAFTRVWSGRFTDRHRNRRSFLRACARATAAIFGSLALLVALASVAPGYAGPAIAVAVVLMIIGSTAASTWHGIAYTELATIAGMKHVGAALGLGNTFAFSTYFLTPLVIPLVLDVSAWQGVWFIAAAAALVASFLFPTPTSPDTGVFRRGPVTVWQQSTRNNS